MPSLTPQSSIVEIIPRRSLKTISIFLMANHQLKPLHANRIGSQRICKLFDEMLHNAPTPKNRDVKKIGEVVNRTESDQTSVFGPV